MSHRVAFAINPTAGRGRAAAGCAAAVEHLKGAGLDVLTLTCGSASELVTQARSALADGIDALVVGGGDGMVHLGVNLVAGTPTPLGIVAAGTGNDIARGLGLPVGDWTGAADVVVRALAAGRSRAIDGARVTSDTGTTWFGGVLGAGFDAVVNERANRMRWPHGPRRYDLAIARELPVFRPRDYAITLDGRLLETAAMLVAVANGPSYGGGMRVCPDALFDDAQLDVLVVEPISRLQFVRLFPKVYAGTHVQHPKVAVHRAARVEVAAEGIVAYADGERLGALPLTCEAVPGALHVLA